MSARYLQIEDGGNVGLKRILILKGEFDLNETSFFEEKVNAVLNGSEYKYFVLDVKELEYLDSSGISALVRLYHQIEKEEDKKLLIYNPPEFIKELFQMANLTNFIQVINTKEELDDLCEK